MTQSSSRLRTTLAERSSSFLPVIPRCYFLRSKPPHAHFSLVRTATTFNRYRSYQNANLVSSKQLTCFSDFRVPLDHPDHFTLPEYVDYLRAYTRHFKFDDRIKLLCRVINVSPARNKDGSPRGNGHIVQYVEGGGTSSNSDVRTLRADYVAVCSGLHVVPSWPSIPGIDHVLHPKPAAADADVLPRQVYHSSEYKDRSQLAGRRVMVLGTGETGHDLAYEAVHAGATEVTLCTRGGFLSFPKVLVS